MRLLFHAEHYSPTSVYVLVKAEETMFVETGWDCFLRVTGERNLNVDTAREPHITAIIPGGR